MSRMRGSHARSEHAGEAGVAVVDLGQYKTLCAIVRRGDDGMMHVMGAARRPSLGMQGACVVDVAQARDGVLSALIEAERLAGLRAHRVVVTTSGGGVSSTVLEGGCVPHSVGVTDRDMRRAMTMAMGQYDDPARTLVDMPVMGWSVDGVDGIMNPTGYAGARLGVQLAGVSAAAGAVSSLYAGVERTGVELRALVAGPYAAGEGVATREEKQRGVIVLDFGAAVTGAGVFVNGALVQVETVPFGGASVTKDVALGLDCALAEAERIKRQHGCVHDDALHDGTGVAFAHVCGEDVARGEDVAGMTSVASVSAMIRARYEEILDLIYDRLGAGLAGEMCVRQLVVTGGAGVVPGVVELAGRRFGGQARLGVPRGVLHRSGAETRPDHAAVMGAARLALSGKIGLRVGGARWEAQARTGREAAPALSRAWAWLRQVV